MLVDELARGEHHRELAVDEQAPALTIHERCTATVRQQEVVHAVLGLLALRVVDDAIDRREQLGPPRGLAQREVREREHREHPRHQLPLGVRPPQLGHVACRPVPDRELPRLDRLHERPREPQVHHGQVERRRRDQRHEGPNDPHAPSLIAARRRSCGDSVELQRELGLDPVLGAMRQQLLRERGSGLHELGHLGLRVIREIGNG